MTVFIDTNVLIDLILKRNGYQDAATILLHQRSGRIQLIASSLTIANIAYILRKKYRGESLYSILNVLTSYFTIADLTASNMEAALLLRASDFEDALQYYVAISNHVHCIVTRNKKDFYFSEIPVISPEELLKGDIPAE